MKRLPVWMLAMFLALGVLFVLVGYHDLDEVGPIPLILGVLWVLITLASAPKVFSDEK